MKLQTITAALATVALVSTVGTASAASTAMSKPSAMHSMTKPELSLTRSQQKLAWKDIQGSGTAQTAPSGFTPRVGEAIPEQLAAKTVPTKLGNDVTALKSYDYALLKNKLLIVSPSDKKIVDVINRQV
jgi:Protein of unknown function (DUF1236)